MTPECNPMAGMVIEAGLDAARVSGLRACGSELDAVGSEDVAVPPGRCGDTTVGLAEILP
jgi:hypothetical protein